MLLLSPLHLALCLLQNACVLCVCAARHCASTPLASGCPFAAEVDAARLHLSIPRILDVLAALNARAHAGAPQPPPHARTSSALTHSLHLCVPVRAAGAAAPATASAADDAAAVDQVDHAMLDSLFASQPPAFRADMMQRERRKKTQAALVRALCAEVLYRTALRCLLLLC